MPLCSRTVKISVHPSLRGGNSSSNFRSALSSLPQFATTISGESQVYLLRFVSWISSPANIPARLHPFADPRFRSRFLFSSGELPVSHSYRHLLRSPIPDLLRSSSTIIFFEPIALHVPQKQALSQLHHLGFIFVFGIFYLMDPLF
ncbi:hypothetical protein HHK36_029564 [Tetracentron sinense]|uniref:Uncharacterized protein n=1 Tax=Tetracentron sinense TaxID=13715 RepID=A0A834YFE8_TETSI|nr:hypothetical protein HHK36_029564 [Tetracentron sinense]